jgi:hypothetical protein
MGFIHTNFPGRKARQGILPVKLRKQVKRLFTAFPGLPNPLPHSVW